MCQAGCAPRDTTPMAPSANRAPSAAPGAIEERSLPAPLRDEGEAAFPDRIGMLRHRSVRLRKDGPTVEGVAADDPGPAEYVVVDASSPWPKILIEQGGIRLLVHVDRADARRVPVSPVRVCLDPGCREPRPPIGIILAPGAPIETGEARAGSVHIKLADDVVQLEGWIPEGALGVVFRPLSDPDFPEVSVLRRGDLLAAPSGPLLARLAERTGAMLLGTEREGYREVSVRGDRWDGLSSMPRRLYEARGFVAATSVTGETARLGRGSSAPPVISGGPHRTEIPAGTRLFDEPGPGGSVIGVARQGASGLPADSTDGAARRRWLVDSPWGMVPVYVAQ